MLKFTGCDDAIPLARVSARPLGRATETILWFERLNSHARSVAYLRSPVKRLDSVGNRVIIW